jgi:hypothetical protein
MKNSLRTWLLVAVGVATACLVFADPILAEIYYTFGLLLFAFGILIAIYARGQRRAFWVGFVILFGIYLSQTTSSSFQLIQLAQFGGIRNPPMGLITTRLLGMIYEGFHPEGFSGRGQFSPNNGMGNVFGGYMAFLTMGHTLFAIGLGVIGGSVAQHLTASVGQTKIRSIEDVLLEVDRDQSDV